jgi:hypothetical protein
MEQNPAKEVPTSRNINKRIQTIRSILLILGILVTCGLIFTMVATPLHQEEIFFNQSTLSIVELIILLGFALVIIFDISSIRDRNLQSSR